MADGRITVDGSPASLDSMRSSLRQLAEQKGVVWYYRENAQLPANAAAKEVIKSVIENRLSIRLSSKPDYSDSIGPGGEPLPAKPPK